MNAMIKKSDWAWLCRYLGHKMQHEEPGNVASAATCKRCDHHVPRIEWPRQPERQP